MNRVLAATGALAAIVSTAAFPANAAETKVFKPSSAWAAEYGDDYCRLARDFSDGKDTISLALERIQPSNTVRLILMGDSIKTFRGTEQLGFTLSPSGGERKGPFWRGKAGDGREYLNLGEIFMAPPFQFGAPPPVAADGPPPAMPQPGTPLPIPPYSRAAEQDFAKGINAVDLTSGVLDPLRIETGGLRAPIQALQTCADDLLKVWGLDPAKHQTMTRPAQPSTEANKWLPASTIGFGDFAKLGAASNQVRVVVSAEGKPTSCAVHWASLETKTNQAICGAIMEKGSFFPALDQEGQPMASYWTVAPFFLLPPFGT